MSTMVQLNNLSLLIVTWDGDELLENCLSSVSRVYGESLELVVVDNAKLDSTRALVSRFKNAKYIPSETNLGFAGGNNLGLSACSRKYVLLLNNDTLIREDSFGPLVEYMEAHPEVAASQGRMQLSKLGNILDDCGVMLTPCGILYNRYLMQKATTAIPTRPVHSVKGAMMMLRKDVISEIGGLFYDHFHCNYEETDFCHRAWLAGFEVHYVDTPAIVHLQSRTIVRLNRVEVFGKMMANHIFSLATTLNFFNAVKIIFTLLLLNFGVACFTALKRRPEGLKIFAFAIKSLRQRRAVLVATRKKVQSLRKISDRELFKKTMSHPGLKYYYHFFKGDLANYKCGK